MNVPWWLLTYESLGPRYCNVGLAGTWGVKGGLVMFMILSLSAKVPTVTQGVNKSLLIPEV